MKAGRPIVIFPEGTRVAPGERAPYRPGIGGLIRQLGVPVIPVALNSGLFWPRRKFIRRPGTIILEFLPADSRPASNAPNSSPLSNRNSSPRPTP